MALDPITGAFDLGGTVVNIAGKIIDKYVPDKAAAQAAKDALASAQQSGELQTELKGLDIVQAEAKGESWLQRNWRPLLMLMFTVIVANNYIIYPYMNLFDIKAMPLDLPDQMWSLLKIGVGGYVVGRSAEKITGSITGKGLADIFGALKK
jgi:hypothetical protein